MPASHLFAYSDEAICVAEDSAVAFYSARTLRKFRVERFSGARICGLCIEARAPVTAATMLRGKRTSAAAAARNAAADDEAGSVLHVIDVEGNWYVVALRNMAVVLSATLQLRRHGGSRVSAAADGGAATRPVVAARRLPPSVVTAAATTTTTTDGDAVAVEQAHFHKAGGVLHAVLLTREGVYEAPLSRHVGTLARHVHNNDNNSNTAAATTSGGGAYVARVIVPFARPLRDCLVAVGWHSGLVVVAQHGQRWLLHTTYRQRTRHGDDATTATATMLLMAQQQQQDLCELPIAVQSLACSPVATDDATTATAVHDDDDNDEDEAACDGASDDADDAVAVAVGGTRGELLIFPRLVSSSSSNSSSSRSRNHYFADHWHHTPLTALAFAVDGRAVYTAAAESVLLIWSLTSYTHTKVTCNTGPVHSIIVHAAAATAAATTTAAAPPPRLLLACRSATLAVVDVLQRRLQAVVEGIEWSAGQPCCDLVVDQWRGSAAVLLMGLPNVLRVCDPVTQQSLYSLHVSSQMETIACAPRYGIRFAGLLRGGQLLVTYERFAGTVLPALLRFWAYDAAAQRHVEVQTVYAPHAREVVALCVDKAHTRVFTLCGDAVKCWQEVCDARSDVYASMSLRDLAAGGGQRRNSGNNNNNDASDGAASRLHSWRNQSTMPTPTRAVQCMALSADGSVCAVADDCVRVYAVRDCRPGEPWPLLCTLMQHVHTRPLRQVVLLTPPSHNNNNDTTVVVVARGGGAASDDDDNDDDDDKHDKHDDDEQQQAQQRACERAVFAWDLSAVASSSSLSLRAHVYHAAAPVTTMCAFADDSVLLATTTTTTTTTTTHAGGVSLALYELCCAPGAHFCHERGRVAVADGLGRGSRDASARCHRRRLLHMQRIPGSATQLAVVDNVSGFRVLHVSVPPPQHEQQHEQQHNVTTEAEAAASAAARVAVDATLTPRARDDAREAGKLTTLHDYFAVSNGSTRRAAPREHDNDDDDDDDAAAAVSATAATRATQAQRWLGTVLLREPAYTAPSMSTVLTQYLRRRTAMSDVNAYLRQVKTAREHDAAPHRASAVSLTPSSLSAQRQRRRRAREHDNKGGGVDDNTTVDMYDDDNKDGGSRRRRVVVGLDMTQLRADVARDKHDSAVAQQRSARAAVVLSACAAATMANGVIQYVMERELGGRHNAVAVTASSSSQQQQQSASSFVDKNAVALSSSSSLAELHVERATLAPAASYALHHVMLPGTASWSRSDGSGDGGVVVTRRTPLPADVVAYRRALRLCRVRSGADFVGGVTAAPSRDHSDDGGGGSATGPRIRRHLRRLLEAALRGRQWSRDDDDDGEGGDGDMAADTNTTTTKTTTTPSSCALDLFATPASAPTPAFSLDAFLHASDSDDASDNADT